MEICSGTIFTQLLTQKTCCTTHLHQILPAGEIYHKSSAQIWSPLPGNRSQSTSQHCRLGLAHYGACLMTDNISSRSKVANSFSHSSYISWLHTYSGLSGNLTSGGLAEECNRAKCDIVAEMIPRVDRGGALVEFYKLTKHEIFPLNQKKKTQLSPGVYRSWWIRRVWARVIYLHNIILRDSVFTIR